MPDYIFENHGPFWLCRPTSDRASHHLRNNVYIYHPAWLGSALAVEPCDVESLALALENDGFSTEL